MDDKLIQLMEEIDKQLKVEEGSLNFFCTTFGEEFEENYLDLMRFADTAVMIPAAIKPVIRLHQDTKSGEIHNQIIKTIDLLENVPHSEKDRAKERLSQQKELLKMEKISEDETEEEMDWGEFLGELQLLPRIIAYAIFTLYSYIDVYTMSLVQYILSVSNVENFYRLLTQFKLGQNPHQRIKDILKDADEKNLSETLRLLLQRKHWEDHQKAFADMIILRNQVAHRKPLTTPQEFQKKFPQLSKTAKIEATKIRDMVKTEVFLDYFRDLFLDLIIGENLEIFFMIRQLATSCYRYLALIDNLVVYWVEKYLNQD